MSTPLVKERIEEIVKDTFLLNKFGIDPHSNFVTLKNKPEIYIVPKSLIPSVEYFFQKTLKGYIPKIDNYNFEFFVAGGSVATYLLYQNSYFIKDIDLFFKSETDFCLYSEFLKKIPGLKEALETDNSNRFKFEDIEIDLIKKTYSNTIEDVFRNFDFNVTKFGFKVLNSKFEFFSACSFNALFNLNLKIEGWRKLTATDKNKMQVLNRVLKYTNKGFKLNVNEKSKLYNYLFSTEQNKSTLEKDIQEALNSDYLFKDDL